MPRYVSPSPSPPRRRRKGSPSSSSKSSSGPSASASVKRESLVKTSLVFLGSIVAATFCAHKFWPKGVTYGDKEEWEIEEVTARIRRDLADEKRGARRRRPASMTADGGGGRYRDGYAYDAHPGRRSAERGWDGRGDRGESKRHGSRGGRSRSNSAAENEGDSLGSSSSSGSRGGRERHDSRDRERSSSRGHWQADRSPSATRERTAVYGQRTSSRRDSYYPPAPQRYAIAAEGYRKRPSSVDGYQPRPYSLDGHRSRPSSAEGRRSRPYYGEVEPEYAYSAPRPSARRSSADGGRRQSRYTGEDYE